MKILVIDDESNIRKSIIDYFNITDKNIICFEAENGLSAQRMLEQDVFDACIIDLKMPGINGLELLSWIRDSGPNLPVIMISAYGEIKDAVEAMKIGAWDYLIKPFEPEELYIKLKRAVSEKKLRDCINLSNSVESDWIGEDTEIIKIKQLIKKIAPASSTVLITGESGTGKEVLARYIHSLSTFSNGPFLPINIGGMPEHLLESELFGYEKGAFTGADKKKYGLFEMSSTGTLFLDEIGEMPQHLQVKLLRVLQDKKIQRLGSVNQIPIDARIITATNSDLKKKAKEGRFRDDLFYRLNVIHIKLPPLRERINDIPLLCGYFIKKLNKKLGKNITNISAKAIELLKNYNFPGNIRELENLMERAMILAEGSILTEKELDTISGNKSRKTIKGSLKELEKQAIIDALYRWEGKREKAARELGITRRTLLNKIKEYNITDF